MKTCLFALLGVVLTFTTARTQFGFNSPAGVKPTQDFEVCTRNGFLVLSV